MPVMHFNGSGWFGSDPERPVCPMFLPGPLLKIMPNLHDLRVVGLGLHIFAVQEEHLRDLKVYLPKSLTALLICRMEICSSSIISTHWRDLFSSFRSLPYLHTIQNFYDYLYKDIREKLPPNLELFGYGPNIHPICRDLATGAVVVSPRWPYPVVQSSGPLMILVTRTGSGCCVTMDMMTGSTTGSTWTRSAEPCARQGK